LGVCAARSQKKFDENSNKTTDSEMALQKLNRFITNVYESSVHVRASEFTTPKRFELLNPYSNLLQGSIPVSKDKGASSG
jgi:hypothetical protein